LVNQTHCEIEILIFDNASTDETPNIVRAYAARDPRIKHIRRPQNVGPMRNFLDSLEASKAVYFCWRAHDDLSSPDFIEKLVAALEENSEAELAVGKILATADGKQIKDAFEMPRITGHPIQDIRRQLRRPNPCVYYGLWRTES